MHLIRIIVPSLLACTTVFAQPAALRSAGLDAPILVAEEGAKRRSELKAALRLSGQAQASTAKNGAMDAVQRQQLRRQLREQSSK